jgi:hypothetical protein
MKRVTSKNILERIIENGSLSKSRLDCYRILHGQNIAITAEELRSIARKMGFPNWIHFPKRLSELERMMAVETCPERKCRITGNEAVTWRITGLMPLHWRPTKITKKERKQEAMNYASDLWKDIKENSLDDDQRGYRFLKLINLIREI